MTWWMAYVAAVMTASALFGFAGWQSRRSRGLARSAKSRDFDCGTSTDAAVPASSLHDVAAACRTALHRVRPLMTRQAVHIDVAVPSGLTTHLRGASLIDLIEEMLTTAIHAAPASRLLLTAFCQGHHIEIAVTDDVPQADQALRLGQVRGLTERVALLGGTLNVAMLPNEGTTMILRVAAAMPVTADCSSSSPTPGKVTVTARG